MTPDQNELIDYGKEQGVKEVELNWNKNNPIFSAGYEAGKSETKKKILESMPPRITERNMKSGVDNWELETVGEVLAFNVCREKVIKIIETL